MRYSVRAPPASKAREDHTSSGTQSGVTVAHPSAIQTMRGIQRSLIPPVLSPGLVPLESKGVVYTKRWVVELLLDLAGYTSKVNLVDSVAVEPAAGEGAFLEPMIRRLVESRGHVVAFLGS